MVRSICIGFGAFLLTPAIHAAEGNEALQERVEQLSRQLQELREHIHGEQSEKNTREVTTLESSDEIAATPPLVDLTPQQIPSLKDSGDSNVLTNPWWRNFDISGFGAAGYFDTGSAGTRDDGGFEIKEVSLFVTADVWENIELFMELQTNRLGKDDDKFTRTGEVYVHFHDIPISDSITVGLKLGRIDIPFGEEYLWQDSIDNPLITNTAAYPYGWDEGILVYGSYGGLSWIAAVTDGTDHRSQEENSDKALNLKISGSPLDALEVSLSVMVNGDVSKSAIEFGGSHFRPVGIAHESTLGVSTSSEVGANLLETNAKYEFSLRNKRAFLAFSLGSAEADDNDPIFDRDFRWFSIEPYLQLNNSWYVLLRYSEIGTYDSSAGYHFDGKTFAGGNSAFGYDTQRFRRMSAGLGWTPNPHVRAKFEIARDWFELIDVSPFTPRNKDRSFAGFEIAVGF